jgi:hypothetical protein
MPACNAIFNYLTAGGGSSTGEARERGSNSVGTEVQQLLDACRKWPELFEGTFSALAAAILGN